MLSHLSIQLVLYSVNSINAIPDIPSPQVRGLFPLVYERKTSEKNIRALMFRCFVQKVEQVEHPPLLPDKHGEYYVPLSDWKVERATKKLKAKEGPYTAGEGTSDTL